MRTLFFLCILALWPYLCFAESEGPKNLPEMISHARALRALMQSDPHRPIYHFVSPEGRARPFDPNGAIYWKGKYHLGFIYQKPREETIKLPGTDYDLDVTHVWGHAVSTDLLRWSLYPDMIDVNENDDELGIFSGGAFLSREGTPHVVYYGLGANANMIAAAGDDELKEWKKFGMKGALISPEGANAFDDTAEYTVFDPDIWYDESADAYYQISGGIKPALFKSKDMAEWTHLGSLIDEDHRRHEPFEDIACPDFFYLGGGKYMLLFISHSMGAQYYVGTFDDDKFTPEHHGRMNWPGGSFFAPEQLQDDQHRNIIWGWVMQPHDATILAKLESDAAFRNYGWSGIMSLPRVVSLGADGALKIEPPKELETIRLGESLEGNVALQPNEEVTLRANGKSIELKLEISGGDRSPFGVKVFASPDGREETIIRYEPEKEELIVDFSNSSASGPVSILTFNAGEYDASKKMSDQFADLFTKKVSEQRAPLQLRKGEPLKLDIFLDRSIIEVFANDRQVVTQIVYPELETSTAVKVFSGDEEVAVRNIRSWQMAETNAW